MNRQEIKSVASLLAEEIKGHFVWGKWLSVKRACLYADVSPNTMRRWINEGLVYASKTTGEYRVDRESIDDFMNMERA